MERIAMTIAKTPEHSVRDIAQAIGTLRQLKQQIEAVRQDFMSGEAGPQLPTEVTQFHLRREMSALDRQIRQALLSAFGEHSTQVRQFEDIGFASRITPGLTNVLIILDGFIFDLEQQRLHRLEATGSPLDSGLDPVTDLYTGTMLRRFLQQELAWSDRHGDSFGLLLLKLPTWPSLRARGVSIANELVISMAAVLKTSLRAHDFPCRLKGGTFGVVLRQLNPCDVPTVTQQLLTNFTVVARSTLGEEKIPIESTMAIYPYDAESIERLFAYAESHWTGFGDKPADEKTVSSLARSPADALPSPVCNPVRSVLIVDDSMDTRLLCARALRSKQFHITLAATAEEAMGLLQKSLFDLIVIDFMLPAATLQLRGSPRNARVINGVGVMHHAVTRCPRMPILFISAHPPDSLRAHGVPPSVPILQKPFRGETFHDTVVELLATIASESPSAHTAPSALQTHLRPRIHPRFIMHCPVTFQGLISGTGHLQDLSLRGCKLRSEVTLSIDTHLTMTICLPSIAPLKVNVAVVRWIKRDVCGVEFVWMEPDMLERLQHYLSRYES
jgi:CheY-like chemotaxis protein/GGDEF domain-containing protein